MARSKGARVALYGNVALKRAYCGDCRSHAIVIDGVLQCCDSVLDDNNVKGHERISIPAEIRKRPSKSEQETILKAQEHKCFYCSRWFGDIVYRNNKPLTLRVEWDHIIPWVYSLNNSSQNFVAACQVCNRLKAAKMFTSLEEVKVFITLRWEEKGYTNVAPRLQ